MKKYKYLIIGGGMTCDAAVHGIRETDPTGSIGIISADSDPPYDRPPLSKGLWKGESIDSIWRKTEEEKVTLHLGRQVNVLFPDIKEAADSAGERYSWEKLLIATGGSPRRLPFGGDDIIYYRTAADYRRLRVLADTRQKFAVIGGGFIGTEVAAALASNGKKVTMIFPSKALGEKVFPKELSDFVTEYYVEKGVELLPGETVSGSETRGKQVAIKLSNREIVVDGVVAGIGIVPNVELAAQAGLKVDNGIVVDEFLRTSHPDIYAAGDVANFYNPSLQKRMRVEHEDNANTMGQMAGANMAGKLERYHHLPFFYSDMFDLGYEAVGELDAGLETFADWIEPNREGVIYYLKEGRVRGVLLWNVWEKVDEARVLIAEAGPFTPEQLKGRLTAEAAHT